MKLWRWFAILVSPFVLAGCGSDEKPKGLGASGKSELSGAKPKETPSEFSKDRLMPGSGLGVGGGDQQGRSRNPETAGKAHERGTGKNKRAEEKEKEADKGAKPESKEAAPTTDESEKAPN